MYADPDVRAARTKRHDAKLFMVYSSVAEASHTIPASVESNHLFTSREQSTTTWMINTRCADESHIVVTSAILFAYSLVLRLSAFGYPIVNPTPCYCKRVHVTRIGPNREHDCI